jgi:hypothetical protein
LPDSEGPRVKVCHTPRLRKEGHPVSETLCLLFFTIPHGGQSPESSLFAIAAKPVEDQVTAVRSADIDLCTPTVGQAWVEGERSKEQYAI